jgi:hypothetical protein
MALGSDHGGSGTCPIASEGPRAPGDHHSVGQQRYGYEALWPRTCSADYSEVETGQQTSCLLGRFRDFDRMNTNSWMHPDDRPCIHLSDQY